MTRPRNDKPVLSIINIRDSFSDFCRVFCPNDSFEKQLRKYIKRYPTMNSYEDYIREAHRRGKLLFTGE